MQEAESHGVEPGAGSGGHGGHEHRGFKESFLIPLAIPVGCALVIAAVIAAISQILLTVPETASTPIAILIALIILFGCAYFATARRIDRQTILLGVAVPALVLFSAGIASAIYKAQHGMERVEEGGASAAALGGGNQGAAPAPEVTTDNKFSVTAYQVEAGKQVTIAVTNKGQAVHNLHILGVTDATGNEPKTDLLQPGQSANLTFSVDKEGSYNFQCDVHPTEMKGTLTVVAANTAAAAATAAGGPGAGGGLSETTTDNKFSQTSLSADHGVSVAMTVQNKGQALHNWHVLNVKDAKGNDIKTDLVPAGQTATVTFQIDQAGTYDFQCDVHPTEMKGKLTVK